VLADPGVSAAVDQVHASGWRPPPSEAPDHDELVAIVRAAAAA
jgi:hypothetical protein